jgi:hypothetical protein
MRARITPIGWEFREVPGFLGVFVVRRKGFVGTQKERGAEQLLTSQ